MVKHVYSYLGLSVGLNVKSKSFTSSEHFLAAEVEVPRSHCVGHMLPAIVCSRRKHRPGYSAGRVFSELAIVSGIKGI